MLVARAERQWVVQAGPGLFVRLLADALGFLQLGLVLLLSPRPQLFQRLRLRLGALHDPFQQAGHLFV